MEENHFALIFMLSGHLSEMLNCLFTQIANKPLTWLNIFAFRWVSGEDDLLNREVSNRIGKKWHWCDFEHGMVFESYTNCCFFKCNFHGGATVSRIYRGI